MQRDIRLEAFYPCPPADVWAALTSRRELASWLMENDFEARPGARFHFQSKPMPGWDGRVDCQVQEIDGLRRLSYSWIGARDMPPTTVTWTLMAEPGGTRLRLVHSGFSGLKYWLVSLYLGRSWKQILRQALARHLDELAKARGDCAKGDGGHPALGVGETGT